MLKLYLKLFTKQKREQDLEYTPGQMLQRLPIALAQLKVGNNSEKLLNEIRHVVYSLYQSKGITKKVYNSINQYKNGYYIYELRK